MATALKICMLPQAVTNTMGGLMQSFKIKPETLRRAARGMQMQADAMQRTLDAALRAQAQIGSLRNDWLNALRDSR